LKAGQPKFGCRLEISILKLLFAFRQPQIPVTKRNLPVFI
jgi:hypothetical protein